MTWAEVYTATVAAGEPAEGAEVEWLKQRWNGEQGVVEFDADYLRMPRLALSGLYVVAGSVEVHLTSSGEELEVIDLTNTLEAQWYQSWPTPPAHKCYAHRRQGDYKNETHIYFNPTLEGQGVNVNYYYYPDDASMIMPAIVGGRLAFNEAGPRHRFVTTANGTAWDTDYSPRFGDLELIAVANAEAGELYAVSAPSYLLVHYSPKWSGYVTVPVYGTDNAIWQMVGALARAGDCYCWEYLGKLYIRNRNSFTSASDFKNVMRVEELSITKYKRVVFRYANGSVALGEGKPELTLSCPYVYDKGHADALCATAYAYYNTDRRELLITCNGILDQETVLAIKALTYHGQRVVVVVTGISFTASNTTVFRASVIGRKSQEVPV